MVLVKGNIAIRADILLFWVLLGGKVSGVVFVLGVRGSLRCCQNINCTV